MWLKKAMGLDVPEEDEQNGEEEAEDDEHRDGDIEDREPEEELEDDGEVGDSDEELEEGRAEGSLCRRMEGEATYGRCQKGKRMEDNLRSTEWTKEGQELGKP